ncbi:hypothetical protein HY419_00290, partial [candidate division WWE3 bacterium]|nr:hypothetical protein [candidate division WWE3 bacterium]
MNRKSSPFYIFALAFIVYFLSGIVFIKAGVNDLLILSEDTIPAMFLPVAIIKDRSLYLDKYYDMMIARYPHPDDKKQILGLTPFYLKKVGTHYLSAFPLMAALLSLPVFLMPMVLNVGITWENLAFLSRLSASLTLSVAGVVLFLLLTKCVDEKKSLLLTFIFLFATINFASISQALWQHGPLQLFSLLALLFIMKSQNDFSMLPVSGFFMGLAVLSRPTAFLPLVLLSVFIFKVFGLRGLVKFALPAGLLFAAYFFYVEAFYLNISNEGYFSQILQGWKTPLYKGFFGMLISPSKGIFVYSPIFIFSLAGWYMVLRKKAASFNDILLRYCGMIVLAHVAIVSMWKHWYGGWSFGYRMASDIIPYLTILLVPFVNSTFYT